MIADHLRTDSYAAAISRVVGPGSVVVDIGTGMGIFALISARLGAKRVYAIESDDIVDVARQIAETNGYSASIDFIQGLSTEVELPETADVIVSDLRGVLPLFQSHLPSIIDARRRFLAPGGVLVPRTDTVWVALVEAPELSPTFPGCGFQVQPATKLLVNSWRKARVTPDQLLTDPHVWAVLDYLTIDTPDVSGEIRCPVQRDGTAHGFVVWFDGVLAEGASLSNSPFAPELVYGSGFFPFTEPVAVTADSVVEIVLSANLVGDDYVWRWETRVLDRGTLKTAFNQSTFQGTPLARARLSKAAPGFAPELTREGEIDRLALQLMNGRRSLTEIARLLSAAFPDRFASEEDSLARTRAISQQYSRC